jgi:AraC-like DNA-binding protein
MTTLIDITFILNGALGLICAIMILFSIRSNRNVNVYLAILIFGASFRMILRGYLELTGQANIISDFSRINIFLIGTPLPYLYFKNLILNQSKIQVKNLVHFILPVMLLIENKFHPIESVIPFNQIREILIISMPIYYCVASFEILRKNIWKKNPPIKIETLEAHLLIRWTIILYVTFLLMGFRVIYSLVIMDYHGDWLTSLAWFIVFMMILTSPSILKTYIHRISKDSETGTKSNSFWRHKPITPIVNKQDLQLSQKINPDIKSYMMQIDSFIEENNFFRQQGLSINDFAHKLKMPKSHLSFLFKYHSEISFTDFKKYVRIKNAIQLIDNEYLKSNTFDSLAKEVGFTTYNTFFISFKEVTGKAPQNYLSAMEKDVVR